MQILNLNTIYYTDLEIKYFLCCVVYLNLQTREGRTEFAGLLFCFFENL